ncbi:MAG: hypothetical protein IJP44_02790 [Bacteroidales bacterium]|nr:hypothetical protein [Bacteroidales bacterium]
MMTKHSIGSNDDIVRYMHTDKHFSTSKKIDMITANYTLRDINTTLNNAVITKSRIVIYDN